MARKLLNYFSGYLNASVYNGDNAGGGGFEWHSRISWKPGSPWGHYWHRHSITNEICGKVCLKTYADQAGQTFQNVSKS